ncbi:MAG: homocysteine S-methyltransferase family protein [Acidobacteriota bacterium]|nr:homocysteine S-methyltransferase family protein [Acidobacteriota bacterium]
MSWEEKLACGEVVVIDGGTGTELQRRGVPMDEASWCGAAMVTHEDVVREVHLDYIRAGAEVIITNTFGTTRLMLEAAGFGDRVGEINRRAVEIAREAVVASGREVAVAGSISAMPGHFNRTTYPGLDAELDSYREVATIFAEAGADLLALEMMEETTHAPLAVQAACETGLPVWLGVSCRLCEVAGELVSFDHERLPFEDVLDALIPFEPTVVNVMHSEIRAVPTAIEMVQQRWHGPIGVYPESGHFQMPDWQFVDVISPDDLAAEAAGWVNAGVRLLGGCCGTGPEHVAALAPLASRS